MKTFVLHDPCGFMIKFFLIAIIWLSGYLQFFIQIPNGLLILGIFLLLSVLMDNKHRLKKSFSFNSLPQSIKLLILFVCLTTLFGFIVAPNISNHITRALTTIEFLGVMLVACYYAITRKNVEFIIKNYIIMYFLIAIRFLMNPILISSFEGTRYSFATGANANGFAFGLMFALWGVLFYVSKKKIGLLPGSVITFVFIYSIYLTGSRKAGIAAIGLVIIWFIFCYIPVDTNTGILRQAGRLLLFVGIIFISIRFFLPSFLNSTTYGRILNMMNRADGSTENRLNMYLRGVQLVKGSPLFGLGFDGYRSIYGGYAHSDIIEALVSGGLVLSPIYYGAYFSMGVMLLKMRRVIKNVNTGDYSSNKITIINVAFLFSLILFYSPGLVHLQSLNSFMMIAEISMLPMININLE